MKYIIAIQNRLNALKEAAFNCVKKQDGQNTVEYIIMLVVVVGIAMLVGKLMQSFMPEVFDNIKAKVLGQINE